MTIRLVVCEQRELARAGIRFALNTAPEVEIVGQTDSSPQALQLVHDLHPDLVLVDMDAANGNGLALARRLTHESTSRVLVLSTQSEPRYVQAAREAGASGYVLRSHAYEELAPAIRRIMDGQSFVTPTMAPGSPPPTSPGSDPTEGPEPEVGSAVHPATRRVP